MSLEKVDVEKYYPYKDKLDLGIFLEKRIVNLDLLENKLDFIIYEKERFIEDEYEDSLNIKRMIVLLELIRDDLKEIEKELNLDEDNIFKTYELDVNNHIINIIIEIRDFFNKHYKIKVDFEDDGKVIIEKEI